MWYLRCQRWSAKIPCRLCPIDSAGSEAVLVPLGITYAWSSRLSRVHCEIEAVPTKSAREQLAKQYGINSRCILSGLRLIDVVASFPYDFMHLMYENLVPNLIKHWTGTFKHLDQGSGHCQHTLAQWVALGEEAAAATCTIPLVFVGTLQYHPR